MSDLSPRTRALLDAARAGFSPSPGDAGRLHPKVMAAIARKGALSSLLVVGALLAAFAAGLTTRLVTRESAPAPAPAPALALAPAPAPAPALAPAFPAPTPTPTPITVPPPPPFHPSTPPPRTRIATPTPHPNPPHSGEREPEADLLAREIALVRQATQASRAGDGATALAATEQHARDFPNGQLAEEAHVLRIEALCQLDRPAAAAAARRAFLSRWPRSAQRDRANRPCGGH